MTLKEITDYLHLPSVNVEAEITGLASLKDAKNGDISFINHSKYFPLLAQSQATAVLIFEKDLKQFKNISKAIPLVCDDPYLAIAYLTKLFTKPPFGACKEPPIIDTTAVIQPNVTIGNGTKIGKNTILMSGVAIGEGVSIGDDCLIYPNVVIYRDSVIGHRVSIHANSVIGSDGFGYAHTAAGEHVKIYHSGIAILEDDVEVGANTAVDRAVFGETRIKRGTKIDNLVQVGHNCVIGEHSLLAGQAGLAGSTTTGRNVVMGGQSGAAGHLHIGDFTTLTVRSTASKSLAPKKIYSGFPSYEHREWLKIQANLKKLASAKR
ncbi:UDP-3-O-(3-hydroxymyristoyl)glucosamine N-acyltransferase [Helicobacter monodelphidis]|uniref:UDP-3-O-(3-hydroxymyristoyl)glucosamine N-acyltransferase n=1 Tax=Helicobacter sp. 15-1451 TaxID=2004995 RepID=UPI000DCC21A0|nr:UDP-3-O-(3-hydroxymyristoyl)glucosamine N-acyltransferase [Helicobacter sp. 15-1451]RAX58009.1 UDP-3-O-(3-hydroxymyristoyl)glucosamine N-acyltransferase [Helicobacter sp. 15-1451]